MRSRRALLFPGQGAYLSGVLMELADDAAVRDVLETVDLVARQNGNEPVSPLLLDAGAVPADELAGTDPPRAHLAIFATSVALYRLLTDSTDARPDVLLGHSFGEIAALTAAGALTVEDGARMVAARDAACARRRPPDGGMVSLSAGATRAGAMLTALGTWEVEVAAVNAPRQTVVSGPEEELSRVEALAAVAGVRARRLRAPYPFHNRVLRPVAEEYAAGLRDITVRPPAVRVFSAIGLRYYTADDDLRQALASHLTTPVRFADAVRDLYEQGVETFVECGARSILTDLVGQNLSGVTTHAPLKQRVGAASAVAAARGGAAPAPPPPP
ncbi:acyltransferase domain-containing protein, partial [Polymorphospora sp. 2-325]